MSDRPVLEVDIVCVGFGPAMGGFLTTLARSGLLAQVICYERADDIGFGVSGAVTRARGIRASFPDLDPAEIPMAARVTDEKVVYLLDPFGASRRSLALAPGGPRHPRAAARPRTMPSSCPTCRRFCARTAVCSFPSASSTSGWATS